MLGSGTADFAWTGAPPHVLDQGDAQCDEAELREVHVMPYRPALEAGCLTVMASYSSVHGTKVHAHAHLELQPHACQAAAPRMPGCSPMHARLQPHAC